MAEIKLDNTDRSMLNMFQVEFPLEEKPFHEIGLRLGISATESMERTKRLKGDGVIRWIGALLDSRKVGYHSTLVALEVDHSRIDEVANNISKHHGVSHNYARNHRYNLWFTLTMPSHQSLEKQARELSDQEGVNATLLLPAVRRFKTGVFFDMLGWDKMEAGVKPGLRGNGEKEYAIREELWPEDSLVLRELQKNLPLVLRPFDSLAANLGIATEELLGRAKVLQRRGILRRYGASVNHQLVGFIANAMTCWEVSVDEVERAGNKVASYSAVTHCYERETSADWTHNLFAMIHGRSQLECETIATKISLASGLGEYIALYSTKEYKKKRVQYLEE